MSIFHTIESFIADGKDQISQKRRKQKLLLYAEGLKAKLVQTKYALKKIIELKNQSDQMSTTTRDDINAVEERLYFYCDTYWAFLYACLDVSAQIINQALNLKCSEREVSFKNIIKKLDKSGNLYKRCNRCIKSNVFKNLDKYRNCSIHRRQICIEEIYGSIKYTPGYKSNATRPLKGVIRRICDNPLDIRPRFNQKREITEYLQKTFEKISKHLEEIIVEIPICKV